MLRAIPLLSALFLILFFASVVQGQSSFTEDFTTTAYRNASQTTADWDVVAGEVHLHPFAASSGWAVDGTGNSRNVDLQGGLVYLADGVDGLEIFTESGTARGIYNTTGYAWDVDAHGDYAYVADGASGLQVIDVSNPDAPTLAATYNSPGYAYGISVEGTIAYLSDGATGLVILDVSNPAAPTWLATFAVSGQARSVDVVGQRVYVANTGGTVVIVDVSTPTAPALVGQSPAVGQVYTVDVEGDVAYAAGYLTGLHVLDVSDPTAPTILTSIGSATVRDLYVDGNRAYLASNVLGLQIYDVTDPSAPVHVEDFAMSSYAYGVRVQGEFAYVANDAAGIRQVRIGQIAAPYTRGSLGGLGFARGSAIQGNTAFVAADLAGMQVVDISNPGSPVKTGTLNTSGNTYDVAAAGDVVYLADGGNGVLAVDVSNLSAPVQVGQYAGASSATGLALSGDRLFVGNGFNGIMALDVSDPTSPTLLGTAPSTGYMRGLVIEGSYAYVTATYGGLAIFDVSNPLAMSLVGSLGTDGVSYDVVVKGDVAFVADGLEGVKVMDVENPASPTLLAAYPTTGICLDVRLVGDRLYVAADTQRVLVLDVSTPSDPVLLYSYATPGDAQGVALSGEHVIVTLGGNGLVVAQGQQSEDDVDRNLAISVPIDGSTQLIPRARISAQKSGFLQLFLSSDGGASYSAATSDGDWVGFPSTGSDLVWRADLEWSPYITDTALRQVEVEWLQEFAEVQAVSDIPSDQGRQVRVEWLRSGYDFVGDPSQIVEYAVYRKIESGLARMAPSERLAEASLNVRDHAALMAANWDFVASAPVRVEDFYAVVVPTLADSTIAEGQSLSTFMVSALTATPGIYFDSPEVSGYSVDNLAPGVPSGLVAHFQPDAVDLDWEDAPESDFRFFRVYRDTDPGFDPSPANRVAEVTDSAWTDPTASPWSFSYKVKAVDFSGNESDAAVMETVTGAPDLERSAAFALHAATPNPFNPTTSIAFELPVRSRVRLEVFDVAGRHVATLRDELMGPGPHSVPWHGKDSKGVRVASGVYLYRLSAGEFTESRRMLLLK